MTVQETIETIKVARAEVEWNYPLDYEEAFEKAIEALEKQIPKKPRKTTEDEEKNYYCSECKYYLGDEPEVQLCMPRPIYCPDCGQALDWSERNANGSNLYENTKGE